MEIGVRVEAQCVPCGCNGQPRLVGAITANAHAEIGVGSDAGHRFFALDTRTAPERLASGWRGTYAPLVRAFSYDAGLSIRSDIPAAHRAVWQRLAGPGTWWTGAERVAIADEVRRARDCSLCAERKQALSPASLQEEHDHGGQLPEAVVEAVHRLATDASRLTKTWLEKLCASGVSDGHYVELLGIVVGIVSIDEFHRALGLSLEPLPAPEPGEPTQYRPDGLREGIAWVPMLVPAETGEAERDLFPGGRTANVVRAMSLVPDAVRMLQRLSSAHYLPLELVPSPGNSGGRALDRMQIELIAGRVSALNECFY